MSSHLLSATNEKTCHCAREITTVHSRSIQHRRRQLLPPRQNQHQPYFLDQTDTRLPSPDPRISAAIMQTDVGPLLIVCVYMPTDYGTAECHEEFIATCADITALYADCNAVHLIAAGDFNCQHGSRFYESFVKFANDNNLCCTDSRFLCNDFTYSNDSCTL